MNGGASVASQENEDSCKINVTAIVNAGFITENLCKHQTIEIGKEILWPKNLVGRPVQIIQIRKPSVQNNGGSPDTERTDKSHDESLNPEDHVFNYGLQVIQMGLFFMQLDDSESEGDGERMMRNWKLLMLYARCSGRSKKYAFEAMRLLTYCRGLLTAKMAHRVIHGQFVNPSGGKGKNYANDLKQEHLVKYNKVILHGLCGTV